MTQSYRLYEAIDQVPLADWNKVIQDSSSSCFMEPSFLRAVEKSLPDQARVFHALLYQTHGRPTACASLCLLPLDVLMLAGPRIEAAGAWGRTLLPNLGKVNVLLCGLPVSLGQSHLAFAPGADRAQAVGLLDSVMQQIGRRHGARLLVFKEFGEEDRGHTNVLCQRGYCRADSPPTYEMANTFPNFAAFCAALRSHYRQNIKRSRQKFERAGCRAVHLENPGAILEAYTPDVHRLYEAVVAKSDIKFEVLPLAFFHELVRQFPGQLTLTAVYRKGHIVAIGWGLAAGREYHFLFAGIDYSHNGDCDLYFNVIYHSLAHAFRCGGDVIRVGQTADVFKTNLGCSGKARYFYVRGTGPITSWALQRSAGLLFPPRQAMTSHDVFKATAASVKPALAR